MTSHVPFCPVIHEYPVKENPNGEKLMLETFVLKHATSLNQPKLHMITQNQPQPPTITEKYQKLTVSTQTQPKAPQISPNHTKLAKTILDQSQNPNQSNHPKPAKPSKTSQKQPKSSRNTSNQRKSSRTTSNQPKASTTTQNQQETTTIMENFAQTFITVSESPIKC